MIAVLRRGRALKKPVFWKKIQLAVSAVAAFLPVVVVFCPELQWLLEADVAGKLITAIGAIMAYLTVATTEKVGF